MNANAYKLFRIDNGELTSTITEGKYRIRYPIGVKLHIPKTLGVFVFTSESTALEYRSKMAKFGTYGIVCIPVFVENIVLIDFPICSDATNERQLDEYYTALRSGCKMESDFRRTNSALAVTDMDGNMTLVRSIFISHDEAAEALGMSNHMIGPNNRILSMLDEDDVLVAEDDDD